MTTKNNIHIPVLAKEIINNLNINPNGIYVDCTAGFGGHSKLIISKLKIGRLICIDQDLSAIKYLNNLFKNKKNVSVVYGNFTNLNKIVSCPVDGFVFDLGVNSLMFDDPNRGFSYKSNGLLDMRMDKQNTLTARYIINNYQPYQLTEIFEKYGETKKTKFVVNKIVQQRKIKPINKTTELANIICSCFKTFNHYRKHPAKTYFQALRIVVNDEINCLINGLKQAINLLKHNGRIAVISFHSIEDRITKKIFKEYTTKKDLFDKFIPISKIIDAQFKLITKKAIIPSQFEISSNFRSHSAKLRVIERI